MIRLLSVIGGSEASEEEYRMAEEVGRLAARRGYGIVCGGRGGVMEAVCRGAKSVGGLTVGILPGHTPDEANPWVDVAIPTGMGEARNALVVSAGEAVIAIGGEYGTLSEIALALKMGKKVVGLRSWELCKNGGKLVGGITKADSPRDAVALALEEAR